MRGKKADTSVMALVIGAIVLAIAAGFLIYWLVTGSNPFGDLIGNIWGKPNVATLAQTCQVACTQSKYDYCQRIKEIKWEDASGKLHKADITCNLLQQQGKVTPKNEKETVPLQLPSAEIDCDMDCTTSCKRIETACSSINVDTSEGTKACEDKNGCKIQEATTTIAKKCVDDAQEVVCGNLNEVDCAEENVCSWA